MKLQEFRRSAGYSQEAFARKIGCSVSMLQKVENGAAQASRGFMDRIKTSFPEVSIDNLFFTNNQQ